MKIKLNKFKSKYQIRVSNGIKKLIKTNMVIVVSDKAVLCYCQPLTLQKVNYNVVAYFRLNNLKLST